MQQIMKLYNPCISSERKKGKKSRNSEGRKKEYIWYYKILHISTVQDFYFSDSLKLF